MLKVRIIPVLLLKNGILVRSKNFSFHQMIGNYIEQVKRFSTWKADEIIYLDISRNEEYNLSKIQHVIGSTSSKSMYIKNSKNNIIDIIKDISSICRVPLTIGGKIRSIEDIRIRLKAGADKVVLNTIAINDPSFIKKAVDEFGAQCIVVCVDVKRSENNIDEWKIYKSFGKVKADLDLKEWLQKIQELGAGEILLQSMDRDGFSTGYDLDLLSYISSCVNVPLIFLGGVGKFEDFLNAHKINPQVSLAAANIFHFSEQSIINIKKFLLKEKVNVRLL
jgi:cyclase